MFPQISINLALSADGKISTTAKRPADWTSAADKERLRALRRGADALLVGRGTWETDCMTMTVQGQEKQPLRCVVSRAGNFDAAHPMFQKPGGDIHLLATAADADLTVPERATLHRGSLESFLHALTQLGVQRLHCEGGGELVRALADLDAIDVIHLTWSANVIFGGATAPTLSGVPGDFLPASRTYELTAFEPNTGTGECFLSYHRVRAAML